MLARTLAVCAALSFVCGPTAHAQAPQHPLDPLGWQEYWTVLDVLAEAGHLDDATEFSRIQLLEPDKAGVWNWEPGSSIDRSAFAVVRQGTRTFEAVIDISGSRLISWAELTGAQPMWLGREFGSGASQVKEHPEFIAAMERRGITDLTFIECNAIPPGYFGTPEQQGRRIGYVYCQSPRGVRNTWARSIGGLTVVVDMADGTVLRVVDEGAVPVSETTAEYDRASLGPPREVKGPIHISQPLGPGFTLDGHLVEWQNWSFHVRPDSRLGMVISTVRYQDGDRSRPVLYESSLSEIFVPYMDPSFAWHSRNFIDAGEFSAGGLTKPLLVGRDCPDHAVYFDHVVSRGDGRPADRPNMICMFERTAGDVSWRHIGDPKASRPKRDLVVRMAAVLGNYDYLFDWVFDQNGSIRIGVGATGIVETKTVVESDASTRPTGDVRADAYGRFVAPNIVGVNHDHYFSFRIDLDVDGPRNDFLIDRLKSVTLPEDNPRRSVWVVDETIARSESQAKMTIDYNRPAVWRVASESATNRVGYRTSYQLMPGSNGNTLLTADDYPRRRAGFIDHHLWVTPYAADERYAAGEYPTLSEPGMGLPAWTSADRSISDTDIVLWHTIGMHHVVRAEDWPVMPVLWHWFELRPFDFFDQNPAMDLPETP
jgi:primary-amine oxidase